MKNLSLLASALLVTAPLAALLGGCGGGGGLIGVPTSTPLPTSTTTPLPTGTVTPVPTSTGQQTTNLTLGNGQQAVLKYSTSGTKITGTLQILAGRSTGAFATRAFTYTFAVGTYIIAGTFTPPRGYNISGTLNGQPLFTMTGQLPTTTQTGSYTLTVDGQTDTGTLPRIGDVTPTATPKATVTPTTAPGGTITSTVTFTKSSDSNFVSGPITPTLVLSSSSGLNVLGSGGSGSNGSSSSLLSIPIINPVTGQTYPASSFQQTSRLINAPSNTVSYYYNVQSGTIKVNEFTSTTASVTYNNVMFVPNEGTVAKGTVTVNGTISGPYKKN